MANDSPAFQIPQILSRLLAQELDSPSQASWKQSLLHLTEDTRTTLLELLQELNNHSSRATATSLKKWDEAHRILSPSEMIAWVDLGTTLSSHSATTAIKYFQDSLNGLEPLSSTQREVVFEAAFELSDRNYAVVIDFLKAAPQVLAVIPLDSLPLWMEPGLHLADTDIVLAVEYFRVSPEMLQWIPPKDLDRWAHVGIKLVVPNQLDKLDYLKAIEYFRLSPEVFSKQSPPELRLTFLELAAELVDASPQATIEFLREGSDLLLQLPSDEARNKTLELGLRLAHRNPMVVMDYLRQAPEMMSLVNNTLSEFEQWVDAGAHLLDHHLDQARAYFNRRTKKEQLATDQLIGGLPLIHVSRILKLYAEGLSGHPVRIKSTEELPADVQESIGQGPATDGRTIYLPQRVRFFQKYRDNFCFYKIATLHEIGHLEFGTYDLDFSSEQNLIERLRHRYPKTPLSGPVKTAEGFFSLYPDAYWAKTLWNILEDARIDYRLRYEYPGIQGEMDQMVAFELSQRPPLEGLPPHQMIQEALLQLSITDTTEAPLELAPIISQAYDLLLRMKHPQAKATDALRILDSLYQLLDEWLETYTPTQGETDPLKIRDQKNQEASRSEKSGQHARSSDTFSYRGTMHPDWVKAVRESEESQPLPSKLQNLDPKAPPESSVKAETTSTPASEHDSWKEPPSTAEPQPAQSQATETSADRFFFYDEWDTRVQDYRPNWSRLMEKHIPPVTTSFMEDTLTHYSGTLKLLRRYFESLKPEAFRKKKRQTEGEEIDWDALFEARMDMRSGLSPTDHIYIKTEKRVRDVAVAFLLDMSGSTSQSIGRTGKRIIHIEKEGLVLLSEALQAVGDTYGIFGFSGQGRNQVEFYILKDFDENARWALTHRMGAIQPLSQNRDGTAIRHAVFKLSKQQAQTRLLILISDGKPLDTDYTGSYALQDTKMALREARIKGVHPYCITIDKETTRYVSEMYGEVRYTIIDNVLTLPNRLPQIYRKLTT